MEEYDALPEKPGILPRRQALLEEIAEVALAAAAPKDSMACVSALKRFQNHAAGPLLFDACCDRLALEGRDDLLTFCRSVDEALPDSMVGNAAFARELQITEEMEEEVFLAKCAAILDESERKPKARIALFMRANHYRPQGRSREAALDCLRLIAGFPDTYRKEDVAIKVNLILEEAGFPLEADILWRAENPEILAEYFAQELALGATDCDETESIPHTLASIYASHSPSLQTIIEHVGLDDALNSATVYEKAVFRARMGRIAVERLDPVATAGQFEEFLKILPNAFAGLPEDSPERQVLIGSCKAAAEGLSGLWTWPCTRASDRELEQVRASLAAREAAARLSETYLTFIEERLKAMGDDGEKRYAAALNEHISLLERMRVRARVVEAYRHFIDIFPGSDSSPQYFMKIAEFYRDSLDMKVKAAEVFAELRENYPNSEYAGPASVRQALCLYEEGHYSEAYEVIQMALAEGLPEHETLKAEFLIPLCEAAMGLNEDAEVHMAAYCEKYPQGSITPRAFFWLGSNKLSQQKYGGALEYFEELVLRYPDSSYAQKAREYIDRLKSISVEAAK
jgi:outer membrane protein assembly factor BamD (BamD/ComL family)